MKKTLAALISLMMALMSFTAWAEEAPIPSITADDLMPVADLSGFVMDVQDDFLLIRTPDGLYVEAHLTDDTLFEGKEIFTGDFVHVIYNGQMTRSLPAQITAMNVQCHMVQGVVSELTEEGFLLTFGEDVWQVNAAPEQLAGIQNDMFVTVYHSGAMTMSLPAQIAAGHIRGQEILGTVTEMMENGFILSVEGEEIPYAVYPMEDAMMFVQPEPGMELIVVTDGVMTSGLDTITVNAVEVLPLPTAQELFDMAGVITEITGDYVVITNADGQQVQVNLSGETAFEGKEIEVGDFIHVTFNGQMTFSIPAQISALKIGCYTHTGTVSDIQETSFILNTELEPIIVNAPAEMISSLTEGMTVTVYSNGAMTMSLPAQIGAELITASETIAD